MMSGKDVQVLSRSCPGFVRWLNWTGKNRDSISQECYSALFLFLAFLS